MDAQVQEPSAIYGAITGSIAVGRYVLDFGAPRGAVLRDASRAERTSFRPRPTPVLLLPRLIRGLIDRRTELAGALSALDAGLPIEVNGEPGIGKTALLRHLAHHPRAASFVDGVVYLWAQHQSSVDLMQVIFEAFYESGGICKPTEVELRRGIQDKQALIFLDDVHLAQNELEQVLDIAPRSAFAVATRERRLWGEVRSVALQGLPVDDAVLLLERELGRAFDVSERSAAAKLCAALGGRPLRILQAAAIISERPISLDAWARDITPENLISELMTSIDEKQRRALLALTALPGVPLQVQHVSGIADVTDIEPSLTTLVRRRLVVRRQARHQLADAVGDRLRRTEDLKPWVNRAITYFTSWAERYRRSPDTLLEESEVLLRVQQYAIDWRRWGEVLRLGRLLEGALVGGARWGAWGITLERCLAAAKAIGDRSTEAWALHEIGTRAVCLGEPGKARASLSQAVKLREALGDDLGVAASRRNLGFVLAPVPDSPHATLRPSRAPKLDLRLRDEAQRAIRIPKTHSVAAMVITALLFAIAGALSYSAATGRLSWTPWNLASISSFLQNALEGTTAATAIVPLPLRTQAEPRGVPSRSVLRATADGPPFAPSAQAASVTNRASILIFTARPGSIATAGRTALCYAVRDAFHVRIEPGIGEVDPTSTLTCSRVAPVRTTTYELSAYGRDGYHARQQLVIVVR